MTQSGLSDFRSSLAHRPLVALFLLPAFHSEITVSTESAHRFPSFHQALPPYHQLQLSEPLPDLLSKVQSNY